MARIQQYPLRYDNDERARWQHAADQAGVALSTWIRGALDRAATQPHPPDPLAVLEVAALPLDRAGMVEALAKVTACPDGKHQGPFERIGEYAKTCQACGRAV